MFQKNRKVIPCYWEMQPSGCTKPHCSFLHTNPRPNISTNVTSTKATAPTDVTKPGNQEWMDRRGNIETPQSLFCSDYIFCGIVLHKYRIKFKFESYLN